jgi:hypothetical protein
VAGAWLRRRSPNAGSRGGLARLAEEQAALRRVATLVARGAPPCPVRPVQPQAAWLPPLQDCELVTQDRDLGRLPRLLTPGRPQLRG